MGTDHWKPVAEREDDARLHAGQLGRQFQVVRQLSKPLAVGAIIPVNAKQVERIRTIRIDLGEFGANGRGYGRWRLQLSNRRQQHAGLPQSLNCALKCRRIHNAAFKSKTRHSPFLPFG